MRIDTENALVLLAQCQGGNTPALLTSERIKCYQLPGTHCQCLQEDRLLYAVKHSVLYISILQRNLLRNDITECILEPTRPICSSGCSHIISLTPPQGWDIQQVLSVCYWIHMSTFSHGPPGLQLILPWMCPETSLYLEGKRLTVSKKPIGY